MCPVSTRGFRPITPKLSLDFIARSLAHYDPQVRGGGKRSQQQQQQPQQASSSSSRRAAEPARRASRLARENDVSAAEEADIKEAFRLFAVRDEEAREDVIPTGDVRRALIALSLTPASPAELRAILASLDPTNTGYATYPSFLTVCALKLHARTTSPEAVLEAIDAAFRLFTNGDDEGPITMAHLRRVARELKEDVGEEVLRDMILEANGGAGVVRGVRRDEFEGVMRRAGAF